MSTVPPELKPISAYVARAHELAKAEPVIAYWCTYYAAQVAMTLAPKSAESNSYLYALMDRLELMKAALDKDEAVVDEGVAAAYVDNFATKIFDQADAEDRAGKATRLTAKKFLASANFLELLSIFGESDAEVRDKIKYSKWKASDIAKAFREGRTPVPGPVGGLPVEPEEERELTNEEEERAVAKELLSLGISGDTELDRLSPSAPPMEEDNDELEVEERSATPEFPAFLNTPTTLPGTVDMPVPFIPPSHQTSALPPPSTTPSAAFPAAVFPSAPALPPPAVQSYFPPAPPAVHQAFSTPVVPLPPLPLAPIAQFIDPAMVAKIQKHAKWAISALNYEDVDTARKELRAALALLG